MVWRRQESLRKQPRLLGRTEHAEVKSAGRMLSLFGLVVPVRGCIGDGQRFVDRTFEVIDAGRPFEYRVEAIVDADLGGSLGSAAGIVELKMAEHSIAVDPL